MLGVICKKEIFPPSSFKVRKEQDFFCEFFVVCLLLLLFLLLLVFLAGMVTYFSNKMFALQIEEAEFNPTIYIIRS